MVKVYSRDWESWFLDDIADDGAFGGVVYEARVVGMQFCLLRARF
jgi:hypothetical protein